MHISKIFLIGATFGFIASIAFMIGQFSEVGKMEQLTSSVVAFQANDEFTGKFSSVKSMGQIALEANTSDYTKFQQQRFHLEFDELGPMD